MSARSRLGRQRVRLLVALVPRPAPALCFWIRSPRGMADFWNNPMTSRRAQLTAYAAWLAASTPCTWKTDFAISRPIVEIDCLGCSSESWELQWHPLLAIWCRWRSHPQHQKQSREFVRRGSDCCLRRAGVFVKSAASCDLVLDFFEQHEEFGTIHVVTRGAHIALDHLSLRKAYN